MGRARHSVRAAIVMRTSGGQRTARPTEVCSGCLWELASFVTPFRRDEGQRGVGLVKTPT